jgi:predicted metal-dependent phosphoesterase TrpH
MKYNNLHCHTTNSDGKLTIQETIKFCEQNGVEAVAFTDHDSVLSKPDIDYLNSYKGNVRWVSGIEISVGEIPELDAKLSSLHMVGLFVDPTNEQLRRFCKRAQNARKERMQRIVNNLKSIDIHITEEDCLEVSGGEAVGRPHIVQAIMKYESNIKRMEELYLEMKEEAANNPIAEEKVRHIEEQGDSQKPYMIFLSEDSYIPNVYVDYLFRPNWDECVNVIRDAGGLSFLAHYFYSSKKLPIPFVEKLLKEKRLDGVEIVYGLEIEENGDENLKVMREQQEKLIKIVQNTDALVSGGSDAHNMEHWKTFVNNKNFAKSTEGILDNILKNSDKKLGWYKS